MPEPFAALVGPAITMKCQLVGLVSCAKGPGPSMLRRGLDSVGYFPDRSELVIPELTDSFFTIKEGTNVLLIFQNGPHYQIILAVIRDIYGFWRKTPVEDAWYMAENPVLNMYVFSSCFSYIASKAVHVDYVVEPRISTAISHPTIVMSEARCD